MPRAAASFRGAVRRIHYAWLVAAVTFLALLTTAGFRSTPGVLIVPLQNEFGWSRATISIAVSINLVVFGLGGPFAAALHERFGVRRVMLTALGLVSAGAALTTLMREPWQLYLLWGVVVGASTGAISVPLAAVVANRWFHRRRGLVTGLLTASNATGQLVFLPILSWVVVSFGWRWAAATVTGAALLLVAPLVAVVVRSGPEEVGALPYGATEPDPPTPRRNAFGAAIGGLRLGAASRDFWILAGSFFICGASTNGLIATHLIPAGMDHGMGEVAAASLLAAIGVFDIVGTTVSGWLTDRYDSRRLLFFYYWFRGLSLLALPWAFGSRHLGLILFVVFYGLDWVATVPPTVALTADTFGRANVGIVFGWIFSAHQLGAAFAAYMAGASRTWFGDYSQAFVGAGLLCLLAAVMVLRIESRGVAQAPPQPLPA